MDGKYLEFFEGERKKVYYVYLMYEWYLEKHEKFKDAVQLKLKELRAIPDTLSIIKAFGWMENI